MRIFIYSFGVYFDVETYLAAILNDILRNGKSVHYRRIFYKKIPGLQQIIEEWQTFYQ